MDICIDFDGTCVEHDYPLVGADVPNAIPVLKELVRNGHRLILWTMRGDRDERPDDPWSTGLTDAINWFKERNIPLYGIQSNPNQWEWTASPKAYAHIYIDNAALGCPLHYFADKRPYVDWFGIMERLYNYPSLHSLFKDEVLISDDFYKAWVDGLIKLSSQ